MVLTVDVDVHEGVENRFHELVVQGREDIVVQLDPLKAVEVLERCCRNVLDPENNAMDFKLLGPNTTTVPL